MVTKDQFHRYVRLQMGGQYNMSDLPVVSALCGLQDDEVKYIQANYVDLEKKHGLSDDDEREMQKK